MSYEQANRAKLTSKILKMVLKLAHLISSSVVCSPIAEARTWQFAARPRPVAKSLQWVVVYSRYHLQVTEIARRQLLNTYRVEHIRIYIMIHRDRCLGRLTRPQARTRRLQAAQEWVWIMLSAPQNHPPSIPICQISLSIHS